MRSNRQRAERPIPAGTRSGRCGPTCRVLAIATRSGFAAAEVSIWRC